MSLTDALYAVIEAADIQAGLAVEHLETGEAYAINGDQPFPMASVFKIPILATAGRQLAAGDLDISMRVALHDSDKSPGSGILPFFEAGLTPTVHDLLTLMMIISDNTATDIVVDLLGGAAVVETYMHSLGLSSIAFKLNCKHLLKTLFPPEVRDLPPQDIAVWAQTNPILYDGLAFSRGPENNVSSACDMNRLLRLLFQGEIVTGALRDTLIAILLNQQFNARLPRFFPAHVRFAHKTGTIGGIRNDSGVIFVGEGSHVAITLFTLWDAAAVWGQPEAEQQRIFEVETAMGRIGRLVYDHFVTSQHTATPLIG